MLNDALFYDTYETIGGEKIMSPSANPFHGSVIDELHTTLNNYMRITGSGRVFTDNIDVYFPDGNVFKPDLVVIKKENWAIIDWRRGIFGVPDMVVEVLSKSTMRRDLTVKKKIYESNGVKEYWIIDPWKESISVYHLRDGKYEFDDEYVYYHEDEWADLTDEQRAEAKLEIKVETVEGLTVKLGDIFDWIIR